MTTTVPSIWPAPDLETVDLNDGSWLSVSEAAYATRADQRTVRTWVQQRLVEFVRTPGGKVWISRRSLILTDPRV